MNKFFKFKDYTFGFADSETEFSREPEIFKSAFYDPKYILDDLVNGSKFILIGGKGVGKTAYSAKIRSLAQNTYDLHAEQISLSHFEFKTFVKNGLEDFSGGKKFKYYWDITLAIEIYKFLNKNYDLSSVSKFNDIIDFLTKNNILLNKNINNTIKFLPSIELNLASFLNIKTDISNAHPCNYSIVDLSEFLLESLEGIYFNNFNNIIIIDGLDDILRYKKDQLDILSGLFRSVNEINNYLYSKNVPFKIIILARTDILANISDPDFNKIKRDGGVSLRWDSKTDALKELVNLRFLLSGVPKENIENHWNSLFPKNIKNKDSWSYILEFTLNKPRDILQFLNQCKETYPYKSRLSYSEVDLILRDYSIDYFLEEMKNELTGFIDDEAIGNITSILSKLGRTNFTFEQFKSIASSIIPNKDNEFFETFLILLFENGYIGQIEVTPSYDRKSNKNIKKRNAIFKHKRPTARIDLSNEFTVHKGLYKALNFSYK